MHPDCVGFHVHSVKKMPSSLLSTDLGPSYQVRPISLFTSAIQPEGDFPSGRSSETSLFSFMRALKSPGLSNFFSAHKPLFAFLDIR